MVAFVNKKPLFSLGHVVGTPAALDAIEEAGQTPGEFLERHVRGDWGEALCDEDKALNDEALKDGSRILSAYLLKKGINGSSVKIWVISEAEDDNGQRPATTILLPEEY